MSNDNFLKSECRRCAGHLEFPADAAGTTVPCPHCGQPTELVAPVLHNEIKASSRKWPWTGAVIFVVVIGIAAAIFLMKKTHSTVSTTSATRTNTLAVAAAPTDGGTVLPGEVDTNDFAISSIRLEKTPGSSLVHITGKVRNLTSRQRFGVKVEFELLDKNETAVGTATDYQPVLDPNGVWVFKALVMESKASSARLNSVVEDHQ